MRKGQIAIVAGGLVLVGLLYFAGKTVLPKKEHKAAHTTESISFEQYEQLRTEQLPEAEKSAYTQLQQQMKAVADGDTATLRPLLQQASGFWHKVGNEPLSAYYMYRLAQVAPEKHAYIHAGDDFVNAFKSGADSIISNNLITFALRSYEEALQKFGDDVEVKIKLAEVYVQGSPEPMKGIEMLRKLSDSLPDNVPALLALGRLSIQSGQYDKAKERLRKVLLLEPENTEAMYFMAISEAQLGNNQEAIRFFEMCKLLVKNEEFSKEIDVIVNDLKNKKN